MQGNQKLNYYIKKQLLLKTKLKLEDSSEGEDEAKKSKKKWEDWNLSPDASFIQHRDSILLKRWEKMKRTYYRKYP